MTSGGDYGRLSFILILLVAVSLQLMPSFTPLALWRPSFVLLVLVYFILYQPYYYGVATAWLTGLMMDFINGGVLGKYALAFAICAYVVQSLRRRFLHARLWHQCPLVFSLVVLVQLIVITINILTGKQFSWEILLFPALSSTALCPLFYYLMQRQIR